MAFTDMAFTPADGLKNATSFPDPETPGQLRAQVQTPSDQLRDFLNGTHKTEVQAAIDAKADEELTYTSVTASRDLAVDDVGNCLDCTHASVAINITIQPNATIACALKKPFYFRQGGAAQLAFVAGSGVTINPATKLKVNAEGDYVGAIQRSLNVWDLIGPTKA